MNINYFNNNINLRLIFGLYCFRRDLLIMKNSLVFFLWSFFIFLFNRFWLMLKGSFLVFFTFGIFLWSISWSRLSLVCIFYIRIWFFFIVCVLIFRGWGRNRLGLRKRSRICLILFIRWCTRCRILKRIGRLVCRGRDCLEGI